MSEKKTQTLENAPVVLADTDFEEMLIANLLVDGTQVNGAVLQKLAPGHFWTVRYGWAYDAMLDIRARGETPDFAAVADELRRRVLRESPPVSQLDEFGGLTEMTRLMTYRRTATVGVQTLARVVRQYGERRALLMFNSETATRLQNETDVDPVTLWADAMERLTNLRPYTGNNDLLLGRDSIAYYDALIQAECENPLWYPPPWVLLADAAPVNKPGDILVIAGPEGSGKSAMAFNWAQFLAEEMDVRVLYIFTEMDKANVLARRKAANSKLPYPKLLKPNEMTDNEWAEFHRADERISEWAHNLDMWEAGAIQARDLLSGIKSQVDTRGTQVVVIDGLNDIDYKVPRTSTHSQTIHEFMSHLETFARENNLLVIGTVQLNREGQEYGSSAYRQKAALLLTIEVETAKSPQSLEFQGVTYGCDVAENSLFRKVRVAKNRRGKSGQKIDMAFLGARFLWIDLPKGTNANDALDAANKAELDLGGGW